MMTIDEQILDYLKQLHMPTMRGCYQQIADQARKEPLSYEQYLLELLKLECETRRQNRIDRNLRASKLPPSKTFDNFDKKRLPTKVAMHLNVLSDGSFLNRCENVLAFGLSGIQAAARPTFYAPSAMSLSNRADGFCLSAAASWYRIC